MKPLNDRAHRAFHMIPDIVAIASGHYPCAGFLDKMAYLPAVRETELVEYTENE
jgi:hypothetical protein